MSISVTDYFLLSAAVTGTALIAAVGLKKPAPAKEPARETTRWKRFLVSPGALHKSVGEPTAVVSEEPPGLKLLVDRRESEAERRWRILDKGGKTVVEMFRRFLFFKRRIRVMLHGRRWLEVSIPRPGEKKAQFFFASPTDTCEVQGSLPARELEIRKQGRLIATVSWQRQEGDPAPRKEYVLEVLKGQDPLPVVTMVLAIEAAFGPAS